MQREGQSLRALRHQAQLDRLGTASTPRVHSPPERTASSGKRSRSGGSGGESLLEALALAMDAEPTVGEAFGACKCFSGSGVGDITGDGNTSGSGGGGGGVSDAVADLRELRRCIQEAVQRPVSAADVEHTLCVLRIAGAGHGMPESLATAVG